tara:strand:+ start:2167 stop:2616 length:450 start_codon:yes stop_codon:yes gene_type:complete
MQTYNLGRQIAVVARLWRVELDRRLLPHNLSQARYVLLTLLVEASGPLAQSDLAEQAGIAGPTLVRQLDHLENAGLVQRRDVPDDRRVKHVCITTAGRAAYESAEAIASGLRQELTVQVGQKQVAELQRSLSTLLLRLDTIRHSDSKND